MFLILKKNNDILIEVWMKKKKNYFNGGLNREKENQES